MNDRHFFDAHANYRQSQFLRDADNYRVARQLRTAARPRAVAERRPQSRLRTGWLLELVFGRPAAR